MSDHHDDPARAIAVALFDLAWLLPRTIGVPAARAEPLPATELEIMRLVARRDGLSLSDVARDLSIKLSNVSAAVTVLVERGLLRRVPDARDGRITRLAPTPAALAAREHREHSWAEQLAQSFEALPRADAMRLRGAAASLRRLADELYRSL